MYYLQRVIFSSLLLASFFGHLTLYIKTAEAKALRQESAQKSEPPISTIINAFIENESKLQEEISRYSCQQEIRVDTLGKDNRSTGSLYRLSEISWTKPGDMKESIRQYPGGSLQGLSLTPTDLTDLSLKTAFPLNKENRSEYHIDYRKQERIDEIDTYVFFVEPKRTPSFSPNARRYFSGQVWVDQRDLQIVKTMGKFLPENADNKLPTLETYCENIDGKHWFPTYRYADEILRFPTAAIHIRIKVRYKTTNSPLLNNAFVVKKFIFLCQNTGASAMRAFVACPSAA